MCSVLFCFLFVCFLFVCFFFVIILFLISPSFGASGKLCFMIVAFPGCLYLYFSTHCYWITKTL